MKQDCAGSSCRHEAYEASARRLPALFGDGRAPLREHHHGTYTHTPREAGRSILAVWSSRFPIHP